MSSYFDHFLLINFFSFLSDSMMIYLIMIAFLFLLKNHLFMVKNKNNVIMNIIMDHFSLLMNQNLNKSYFKYVFPFLSVFFFLILMNFMGYFLYTHPMTTHMSMTLNFAFMLWFCVFVTGVMLHKFDFFSMFMPNGSPLMLSTLLILIEIMSYISSPMALGMSLAANLTAGHILLAMLSDFSCKLLLLNYKVMVLFPLLIMIFMLFLELGVLVIQAYVFVLLVMVYLKDSLHLH